HFVRPVHTVTLLLGDKVILAPILGIQSARVIRAHRFMGEPEFTNANADPAPEILRDRWNIKCDYADSKADREPKAQKTCPKKWGERSHSGRTGGERGGGG
ncbi:glycine--tRNA ligase subunit beta, partial [Escherichia coli]|uniref:glycine--tRNA ligase subunit beta n=1 Tax=Escherichia coli TaxID=562 RepID=UPI0010CC5BF2